MLEQLAAFTEWPYLIWAAAAATSFYGATIWAVSHLHPDKKAHLSLWLQGDYNSTWTTQFCAMFDQLFGAKHLGWRCFTRSAIASFIAVFALWLLLDQILGLISLRADTGLSLTQALLLGAAINIIPDYISLFETRWLLQQFERVRHPLGQMVVLLLDAVATGLIIYGGITAYLWVTGQTPIAFIEMIALFSIYAVFFYSTFLTSFWAWAYCISSWIAWLSGRLRGWLDMQDRPGRSLALIGGALVLMGGVALKPALTMNEDGRIAFDNFLCDTFPGSACTHVARLTVDEEEKLVLLGRACFGGVTEECFDVAHSVSDVRPEEAVGLYEKACQASDTKSCVNLGVLYEQGLGVGQDYQKAFEFYTRGCDGGFAISCSNLASLYKRGLGTHQDYAKSLDLNRRTCDDGDALSCAQLGEHYDNGWGVAADLKIALDLYGKACLGRIPSGCAALGHLHLKVDANSPNYRLAREAFYSACIYGSAHGCSQVGAMFEEGLPVVQDYARARDFYRQGCEGGDTHGCTGLGFLFQEGLGGARDYVGAGNLYAEGCDREDALACSGLGFFHFAGIGVPQNYAVAHALYLQGCDGGSALGCSDLGKIYQNGLGVEASLDQARVFYGQACELGDEWACEKLADDDLSTSD